MPVFSIQFDVVVATLGAVKSVTVSNITAVDASAAIAQAQATLVQVVPVGVVRTAP